MDDSVVTCDEIIESYNEEINFNEKKVACKTQNFYILFLLITIALLIAISIYCYLIKYQGKQNNLLPFHSKDDELKEIIYKKLVTKWKI